MGGWTCICGDKNEWGKIDCRSCGHSNPTGAEDATEALVEKLESQLKPVLADASTPALIEELKKRGQVEFTSK